MAEVQLDKVVITLKNSKNKDEKPKTEEIPAGFVLWSTGIGESTILIDGAHSPLASD